MADGTLLRTGMGQLEGAKCWQLFKNGYGPGLRWTLQSEQFRNRR